MNDPEDSTTDIHSGVNTFLFFYVPPPLARTKRTSVDIFLYWYILSAELFVYLGYL